MASLSEFKRAMQVLLDGFDKPMSTRLAAATALALTGGALAGLAPLALKEMIDAMHGIPEAGHGLPAWVWILGAAYMLCLSVARLCTELRPQLLGALEQRLYARLRVHYFKHLLDLPLGFHLERRTGALLHNLQQAVAGYQIVLTCLLNALVPVLVEAITVTLVLISLDQPTLTACFALTAAALTLVMRLHLRRLGVAAQAVSRASIDTQAQLADGLINYEPIKCFGAERRTLERFAKLSRILESRWAALHRRRAAIGLAATLIFSLGASASLVLTLHAVHHGTLSVGGFVLVNLYIVQIIRPLEMLNNSVRDISQALAFIHPLMDNLQESTRVTRQTESGIDRCVPCGEPTLQTHPRELDAVALSFHDVHLHFQEGKPVLSGFNLEVPAGRSIAIVGTSGSGKSSLVRLLVRLCEPTAGEITLNGRPIHTLPLDELRSIIAVVPQDLALLNSTIAANIGLGRESATRSDIVDAARRAGLHDFIETLTEGYDTAIGERGLKLSGGERQRIAIARAILRDPLVFLFDEATSMLDGATERALLQEIRALSAGRTTITIAHRLLAIQHVDEIAVLANGRIAEQGDHATLLARGGLYADMWRDQQPIDMSSSHHGIGRHGHSTRDAGGPGHAHGPRA